ncbi:carbohydrate binding domain-containing protein, partial [Streptomyces sp. CO7]
MTERRFPDRLLRRGPAALTAAVAAFSLLMAMPATSFPGTEATAAAGENTATVFYYTKTKNWAAYNLHYAPDGGSWTTVPGVAMEAACTDWVKRTVTLGAAAGLQATFTNGSGTWDNNGGKNYSLGTGSITVKDGVVAHSDPCAGGTDPDPSPSP